MRRFRFPFDPLVRLKQQHYRQAELLREKKRMVRDTIEVEMAALRRDMATTSAAMAQSVGKPSTVYRQQSYVDYAAMLRSRLDEARKRLQGAIAEYEQAQQACAKIDTEIESLLSLREEHWKNHCRDNERLRQQQADSWVMSRWDRQGTKDKEHVDHG